MATKNRRVTAYLPPALDAMLMEIHEKRGDTNESDSIKECIRITHNKMFPPYVRQSPNAPLPEVEDNTPPAEARMKVLKKQAVDEETRKKARAEVKLEKQIGVCMALKGTVNETRTHCTYYTYAEKERFEQVVPLSLMTDDLLKHQFNPSKERVETLQKEGRVNYKHNAKAK